MKKYRFKLENLLKYRESIEERKSFDLADAIREYEVQEKYIRKLTMERQNSQKEFSQKQSQGITGALASLYINYMDNVDTKIKEEKASLDVLSENVEEMRKAFLEARKERKVAEELKSSDFKRYQQEVARLEQHILDEAASVRSHPEHRGRITNYGSPNS